MTMNVRSIARPKRRMSPGLLGALATGLVILGLVGGLAGCGDIQPIAPHEEPITDPTQLYMRLTLDHPAVNLSTAPGYTTLQLTATPRDALGNAMSGLPMPTFTSSDTTTVRVSADGLLTAVGTGSGITVTASLTVGPVTHTDEAWVNVTDLANPPTLASLSIQPVPPDSAVWPVVRFWQVPAWAPSPDVLQAFSATALMGSVGYIDPAFAAYIPLGEGGGVSYTLAPRVVDTDGAPVAGLQIVFTSLDPEIAELSPAGRRTGTVLVRRPGQVRIVAQTAAYGVAKTDTVMYTVTLPIVLQAIALPGPSGVPVFEPSEARIAPYGYVAWFNYLGDSVDVTFDDPVNVISPPAGVCDALLVLFPFFVPDVCGAGDVLLPLPPVLPSFFPPGYSGIATLRFRQFPVPGVYTYHSTRTGATGRVVVTDEPYTD